MINNYNNKITINYSNREIYLMNLSNKSNIKMFLYVCISVVKKIISGFNTEAWSKICNIVMLVYHLALSYIIVVVILKLCSLILLRSLRMQFDFSGYYQAYHYNHCNYYQDNQKADDPCYAGQRVTYPATNHFV